MIIRKRNKNFTIRGANYVLKSLQRMKNTKKQATFTLSDPIRHPLWVRYEEVLETLRVLYEELVPSAVGKGGEPKNRSNEEKNIRI